MPVVSLSTFRAMLRIDFDADDAMLSFYLDAAAAFVERHTRRKLSLVTRTVVVHEDWPDSITLPFPPFVSVTAVTYKDAAGATQTLSSSKYRINESGPLARVEFYDDLPDQHADVPRIAVAYTCGYAAGAIPHDLQLAVMRIAGTYYMNPEAVAMLTLNEVPFGARAVINNYAVPTLSAEGLDA